MATKKQEAAELTAPDPFLERANEYAGWVEKNFRMLLILFGAAVVAGIVVLLLSQQRQRADSEVTAALSAAIESYSEATDPATTMTTTTTEALQQKAQAAMPKLEAIVKEHGDHSAAKIARVYLGDLARRAGDHARAEQLFKEYAAGVQTDDPLLFLALEGAGYALEEQKKLDEALTWFVKLQELPGKGFDDLALKHQARIHELKGDREAALKAYRTLVEQFPESKLRDFADSRIGVLE